MKNIILASAVLVSSFGVYACEDVSSLADIAMRARQGGLSASEAYKISAVAPESMRHVFQEMIKLAYYFPVEDSYEAQREEISYFSSVWFLACLETMGPTQ